MEEPSRSVTRTDVYGAVMARMFSNVSPEDIEAMATILARIVGTPIEPTGDIKIEVDGEEYVIKGQESGHHYGASVDR